MADAQSTIDVVVPIRKAYDQWTYLESFPHFMSGVESVTRIDHGRTHWVVKIAGVEREFDAEVTDQVEDSVLAWHSTGELKQGGRVEFVEVGPHTTKVTLTVNWEPEGFVEKAGAAFNVDSSVVKADLEQFKKFIEPQD